MVSSSAFLSWQAVIASATNCFVLFFFIRPQSSVVRRQLSAYSIVNDRFLSGSPLLDDWTTDYFQAFTALADDRRLTTDDYSCTGLSFGYIRRQPDPAVCPLAFHQPARPVP